MNYDNAVDSIDQTNFSPQLIHIRKLSKSLDQLNKVNPCRKENFQNEESTRLRSWMLLPLTLHKSSS